MSTLDNMYDILKPMQGHSLFHDMAVAATL